jgi:hypothetical protein
MLEAELKPVREKEAYREVSRLLEAARARHEGPEWGKGIDLRLRELELEVERLFAAAREEAVQAKRKGENERVTRTRERVARWGLEARSAALEQALAAVTPDPPAPSAKPPDPPAPPPPSEAVVYQGRWEAAARLAAGRDYAAGVRELEQASDALRDERVRAEAAADLAAFRQAESAYAEILRAVAAWPKGEKLAVAFLDQSGAPQRAEGTVARFEAGRLELRGDKALHVVPWGRVLAGSLAEAVARGKLPPAEPGRVLFCLLDGDSEGAARLQPAGAPAPPEKYRAHAKSLAAPQGSEKDAWTLFAAAERAFPDPASAAEAVLQFGKLLGDFADTALVRRNRDWIEARAKGGREFLFLPPDWSPSGTFRLARHNRMETCWISERDDPASLKDNFVEIAFSTLPDTEYRCWVYVGGCCLEVFGFLVQGTEFPGGEAPAPVKMASVFGVPRTHASHSGPKEPDRWTWVPIPLPRYASPGAKRLRLHTTQKGFSVAYAFVSALKAAPPRDAEVKDAEKARAESGAEAFADPSLIGFWRLDEGKGAQAQDASKGRNGGFLRNGAVWAAGKVGGALSFDGVDDMLEVADFRYGAVTDTFSMAFWASPAATREPTPESNSGAPGISGQRYVCVPSHGDSYGAGHAGAGVSVGTNGVSVFEHAGAHMPSLLVHEAALSGWVHVAVVFERRVPKLYLNGAPVRTGVPSTKTVHPSPATVGHAYGFYRGLVDDIRVYSRALSAAEVAALAGGASVPPVPAPAPAPAPAPKAPKEGLLALYRFEEGKGSTIHDVSGVGAPLNLEIPAEDATRWIRKRGLNVYQPTLLASAAPATKVIEACKASREISVEAWVRPANGSQTGPARIVSFSADIGQRNFTLGQAANAYEARLRTSATNANGLPGVAAPGADPRLTHLVYTRAAAGTARLYVNGVEAGSATVSGDFSTWNAGYRLLLANELTRERPWTGEFHLVAIYSRSLAAVEVLQKFKAGPE